MVALIREGKAHQKAGRWAKALDAYEQAYAIDPRPALLYPMGLASERMGKIREAIDYYTRLVEALPDKRASKRVEARLPELRAQIPPTVEITTQPSGANVYLGSLESQPIGSTPYNGEFELGTRRVIIVLDGYEAVSREYTFEGAEQERIEATLVPISSGGSLAPTVSATQGHERSRSGVRGRLDRDMGRRRVGCGRGDARRGRPV